MKKNKLDGVLLKKGDYLVEHLPNYFRKKDSNTFSSKLRDNDNCFVGVIRKIAPFGCSVNGQDDVLVYYQRDVCPVMDVQGIGTYHVVNEVYTILFRVDQDPNDYINN